MKFSLYYGEVDPAPPVKGLMFPWGVEGFHFTKVVKFHLHKSMRVNHNKNCCYTQNHIGYVYCGIIEDKIILERAHVHLSTDS